MENRLITSDVKEVIREALRELAIDVAIEVFTKKGVNDTFNGATVQLMEAIAEVAPRVRPVFLDAEDDRAARRDVHRFPAILIAPEEYSIRITGAPLGEESRALIVSLLMVGTRSVILSEASVNALSGLRERREIKVFVSPTCPYCPQQVLFAASAAIVRPDLISLESIEIFENQDLAEQMGVLSVPQTFVNGVLIAQGLATEEHFIESLLTLKEPVAIQGQREGPPTHKDVLVIGAGPAGLTAGIYAERAGLRTVIIEKGNIGGQIAITPIVENYPGFTKIGGKSLVDLMAQQALRYCEMRLSEYVTGIELRDGGFEVRTNRAVYRVRALIIATGVAPRRLNIPGEERLYGRGVSSFAECDGYLFKDGKKVFVIGGGNSAVTYALYLHNLGAHVTVVHRRGELRAQKRLQDSLFSAGIPVMWRAELREIIGDSRVQAVRIRLSDDQTERELPADGVFMAIGYEPAGQVADMLRLARDEAGYIKVDDRMRTSIPGVYAAGDITGGVKQIVVAVGQGSIAAGAAFEDLANPYWAPHRLSSPASLQE